MIISNQGLMPQIVNKRRARVEKTTLFYFIYLYIAQKKVLYKQKVWTNLSTPSFTPNFSNYNAKNLCLPSFQLICSKIIKSICSNFSAFLDRFTHKSGQICPLFLLVKTWYHSTLKLKRGACVR